MTKLIPHGNAANTLQRWARFGETISRTQRKQPVDWGPVQRLITAVQPLLDLERQRLSDLLEQSSKILRVVQSHIRQRVRMFGTAIYPLTFILSLQGRGKEKREGVKPFPAHGENLTSSSPILYAVISRMGWAHG